MIYKASINGKVARHHLGTLMNIIKYTNIWESERGLAFLGILLQNIRQIQNEQLGNNSLRKESQRQNSELSNPTQVITQVKTEL